MYNIHSSGLCDTRTLPKTWSSSNAHVPQYSARGSNYIIYILLLFAVHSNRDRRRHRRFIFIIYNMYTRVPTNV